MLNKIIVVNIIFFVILILFKVIARLYFPTIFSYISLSSDSLSLLFRPWTIISYSFVHIDLYHLIFNMLVFYWFGNIVGDLLGDKKILPLYWLGSIGGGITFLLYTYLGGSTSTLHGASAAVMATVMAATVIAPNYQVNLVLIGKTSIKYIALGYIIIDLAMLSNSINTGGHVSHFGGLITGGIFAYLLKKGQDLSLPFNRFFEQLSNLVSINKRKSNLNLVHRGNRSSRDKSSKPTDSTTSKRANSKVNQAEVDKILEKIKQKGYDSLNKAEKEALFMASKRNSDSN